MAQKIILGETTLSSLHEVFELTEEQLEARKARLFPIGNTEQEQATVSIFLSSLCAVKEYREELFLSLGINKIRARNVNVHVYTEIQDGNKANRPDALIVITSGKHNPLIEWAGFIEAKISENMLEDSQIEKYTDFAREKGINEIITISNYLVTSPLCSPIKSSKRNFKFYHWSWAYLKVIASRLIKTNKIEDEDHVYILSELRKYMDSHKNLRHFINMGKDWKDNVIAIQSHREDSRVSAELSSSIVDALIQEEKDISLQLTDNSDFYVELLVKNDRREEIDKMLQEKKVVTSTFIINNDKNCKFSIDIDFIRQKVQCSTNIFIEQGKAQAQTTKLIDILKNAGHSEELYINAIYPRNKFLQKDTISLSCLFKEREKRVNLYSILDKNLGEEVKRFEVKTKDSFGKDFQGNKKFITRLEKVAERFLNQVMVNFI